MANLTMTNEELAAFRGIAQQYINRVKERNRLHYALEKFLKKTRVAFEDYQDAEQDLRVDCAQKEKDGKSFVYIETMTPTGPTKVLSIDPDKAKQLQKGLRELGRKQVEIEDVYYCRDKEVINSLESIWLQHFIGVVIEEDPLDEEPEAKESKILTLAD